MLKSGVQEASEEEGAGRILNPQEVLEKVHSVKTGILFQAPWVIPELIESKNLTSLSPIKTGLFKIGMGCQILDDMVDLSMDARMNRHNYVASLIVHGGNIAEQKMFNRYLAGESREPYDPDFLFNFPKARQASARTALSLLQEGTQLLFDDTHRFMGDYCVDFFAKRIGAHRFLYHGKRIR